MFAPYSDVESCPTFEIFVVSYAGLPGTYEWNRVHFLDFLSGLHDLHAAPAQPNKPLQQTGADDTDGAGC